MTQNLNESDEKEIDKEEISDTGMTMKEYMEQQLELEHQARELMPRKFDNCSYPLGYLRQNLYICLDCTAKDCPAAICYSCSISCHTSCHIIELNSKRHFKCDCGHPSKFPVSTIISPSSLPCRLFKGKDLNHENDYHKALHNFQGRFCICDKFYDEEDDDNGIMLQCLNCEDWFHTKCVDAPNDLDSFTNFVCKKCHEKRPELSCLAKHDSCPSNSLNSIFPFSPINIFLPENWYEDNKCSCNESLFEEFKDEPVYEPDLDEPIPSSDSIYADALKILETNVNRTTAISAIEKMHTLKDSLVNFLGSFPQGHCVTKEVNFLF